LIDGAVAAVQGWLSRRSGLSRTRGRRLSLRGTRGARLLKGIALVLIVLSWGIFILGLGLTIPVWPEW
jgi:hypothetical protein